MAAHRQQPELILLRKLTQTNSTVKRLLQANNLLVLKHRKSIDESLIQARVVEVEELLQLPLESIRSGDFWVSVGLSRCRRRWVLYEKSNKQVEEARDEKQNSKNHYDEENSRTNSSPR